MILKKIFDFFIFTSLFIAVCAMLMVYQTAILFHIQLPFALYGFVFFGSVCSYNFHWYLTPPNIPHPSEKLRWAITNKSVHLVLFIIGLIGSGIFTLLLINHWFWLGVTAFVTFMYSAPKIPHPLFSGIRKVAIGKTIFLAFSWAHVTSLLPLVITIKYLQAPHICFVINRFFFIYAICILFDYRDIEEDRKAGIKSLITFLNDKGVAILFWCSVAIFAISSFVLLQYLSLPIVIALLIPGIILCFLYPASKKNSSDYLYYFVLDGLMMLSSPLLLLVKFAG